MQRSLRPPNCQARAWIASWLAIPPQEPRSRWPSASILGHSGLKLQSLVSSTPPPPTVLLIAASVLATKQNTGRWGRYAK